MFFDTPNEEAEKGFQLLPDGEYEVMVFDSEYKANRSGQGHHMSVAFKVLRGKHEGHLVVQNFNIDHPSEQAQRIGKAQFKAFLAAVGVSAALPTVNDFHRQTADKRLRIVVGQKPGDNGKLWQTVSRYLPIGGIPAPVREKPPHPSMTAEKLEDNIPF